MKRMKWICFGFIVMILGLAACSPTSKTPVPLEEDKEPLILRITWKTYSGRGEAIQRIINGYVPPAGSRFIIVLKDGDEDLNNTEKDMYTGSSDIYVLPYRYVRYFGQQKSLLDMTTLFPEGSELFDEALWKLGFAEDRVYGVPWLGHSMGLIYNKGLLSKAGVDPTQIMSMQDLITALEKIEAQTDAQGIGLVGAEHNDVSWMVNQFVYGYGATLVDDAGARVAVNDPRAAAAIEFYRTVLGSHAQTTWQNDTGVEVMTAFRQQKIAFEIQGPWGITDIWKNGNPFEVGVIPLEQIGLNAEVGPMMLSLPTGISQEKKAAALDFIRYLTSASAQEQIMEGEYSPEHDTYYPFRIPVRKDLSDSLIFQKYKEFIPFLEGFKNPSVDVPVSEWQQIKDRFYAPGLHRVMIGELSVEEFLQEIETEGNKILGTQ